MKLFCAASAFLLCTGCLFGQASGTAEQSVRLFAYGTGSLVRPASTGTLGNRGFTLGATANVFRFGHAEIGLDVRGLISTGTLYKESVFAGGPRLQYDLGRFQPYAAFHIGTGSITFKQPADPAYTSDSSTVYGAEGGLDYCLGRSWAIRGEVGAQRWQLGATMPAFHPLSVSAGLRYQFHFHNGHGPE